MNSKFDWFYILVEEIFLDIIKDYNLIISKNNRVVNLEGKSAKLSLILADNSDLGKFGISNFVSDINIRLMLDNMKWLPNGYKSIDMIKLFDSVILDEKKGGLFDENSMNFATDNVEELIRLRILLIKQIIITYFKDIFIGRLDERFAVSLKNEIENNYLAYSINNSGLDKDNTILKKYYQGDEDWKKEFIQFLKLNGKYPKELDK